MPARVLQREWLQLHLSEHASKWAVAVVYLAAYIILEWASFIHVHKGLPITPWDPGLGVAFALMIRGGPLSGLILFAGMVVAETLVLQNDVDWPIDIGVAAITATSYASVAALVQRYFRIDADLTHLRDVLMLLAAGLAGAVLNTVLLSAFLLAVGQFNIGDVVQVARPLLIGDTIGIAVVTPLLLRFRVRERLETHRLGKCTISLPHRRRTLADYRPRRGVWIQAVLPAVRSGCDRRGSPWRRRRLLQSGRNPVQPHRAPALLRIRCRRIHRIPDFAAGADGDRAHRWRRHQRTQELRSNCSRCPGTSC